MTTNPLFPGTSSHTPPHHPARASSAASTAAEERDAAANIIRQKLAGIYAEEPDAAQEISQDRQLSAAHGQPARSRHQQFMHDLSTSGKSLAEIQTAWHHYYANLPDSDKHRVWQEFYEQSRNAQQQTSQPPAAQPVSQDPKPSSEPAATSPNLTAIPRVPASVYPTATALGMEPAGTAAHPRPEAVDTYAVEDERPASAIRAGLRDTVGQRAKLKPKHHVQSLLFGLGCGGLALLVVLFSFFNEMFIAPFLQPSRTVSATPIIIGADGIAPSDRAEVIIPKINVQIPLDYSAPSIKEDDIQKALEKGVVHYPTTVMPGQQGNAAFFGHSSNNIFNPGDYKFAFVLLHELVPGDTFYLTRDGVAYAYQVIDKKVIEPTEVDILDPIPGKTATATLITCDPPGTTLRRLAVIGEQVSPNPTANTPGAPAPVTADGSQQTASELPGPAPSFWHRMTSWISD